jgi:hypothetical protein
MVICSLPLLLMMQKAKPEKIAPAPL